MGGKVEFCDLQDEILLHIFHKLGLKLVVRCKLVCKRWRSLITDPFFTSKYNPGSIPNHPTSLIMIPEEDFLSSNGSTALFEVDNKIGLNYDSQYPPVDGHDVPIYFLKQGCHSVKVLGSWNGLVGLYDRRGGFCLLNPWTKEEKRVQVGEGIGPSFDLRGLCHDPARDEYKAVLSSSGSTSFYVVSFKDAGNCKSKARPADLYSNWDGFRFMSTVVEGVPHWISCTEWGCASDSIIYFDQLREEFGEVRLPKDDVGNKGLVGLGALDGQLTVAVRGQLVGVLQVWALKEENSWTKLFAIVNYSPSRPACTISLASWITDDQVLLVEYRTHLSIYNVREQDLRNLNWMGVMQRRIRMHSRAARTIVTFNPTLVNPNQCGS